MTTASAPGRVNLIGEHTDYNDGFVLPTVIPQHTTVTLAPRDDDRVVVTSRQMGATADYQLGQELRGGTWLDYVMGCTAVLRDVGHQFGGASLDITSDVPLGSGLSSSAALEVAVLRAFREAFSLDLDDVALALLGQRAENDLVGAPVGAMDQLASSLGAPGVALFIDIRSLEVRRVSLPAADLLVISSGVRHDHVSGDYRTRRAECERAAALLGVASLRDVTEAGRVEALPEPLNRRARHVVTENARVVEAVAAMTSGDLAALGRLFAASHRSMRDDYQVSVPAIDALVSIADADPDVLGARLTGGGFGGSIVAFSRPGTGAAAATRIADAYARATGNRPEVLVPAPESR